MPASSSPLLGVSTYSLSHVLGVTYADAPGNNGQRVRRETYGPGTLTLLDLPARLAAMGISALEISHPQLPSRESAYLDELRAALKEAGVQLFSVLIEDGDLTHPEHRARDLDWMSGWIETAGRLGAERARVIAGKAPYSEEAMRQSRAGLRQLAQRGRDNGVRVTTENWFALLSTPQAVLGLLDSLEGEVGFNLDFGNWGGPSKYEDLAAIFPRAESCHAKCEFIAPRTPNAEDFRRCLALARAAQFHGPFTLIYNSGGDEWEGIEIERDLILDYFRR